MKIDKEGFLFFDPLTQRFNICFPDKETFEIHCEDHFKLYDDNFKWFDVRVELNHDNEWYAIDPEGNTHLLKEDMLAKK